MCLNSPVLLIVFNRAATTRRVLEKIREAMPLQLFIASDGPRNREDVKSIQEVRDIIHDLVDWNCKVEFKYSKENLGCKLAVSEAITWFFSQVEEGIILEDDCLPASGFFEFCEELLLTYRHDERIGHISGSHLILRSDETSSYYISRYAFTWGWASWARVWRKYDLALTDYRSLDYENIFESAFERIYWLDKFHQCALGNINTWDYQYFYTLCRHGLLSVNSTKNLISNIGFTDRPTHWNIKNIRLANLPIRKLDKLKHPVNLKVDPSVDHLIYRSIFARIFLSNIFLYFKYFNFFQSAPRMKLFSLFKTSALQPK